MKNLALKFLIPSLTLVLFTGCLYKVKIYEKNPMLGEREGLLRVPGLNGEVEVFFDSYGVPHIFSDDEHDLFFAIGFIQAQDRLFEMVLLRAISEGRMSELLGDLSLPISFGGIPLSTVKYDIHQRVWGIKYLGEIAEVLKEEMPEIYNQIDAYVDGVNTYIELNKDKLPLEFQVLKIKPEEFRVGDVLSLGLFIGTMLTGNHNVELLRYAIMKEYGWEKTWKLVPYHTQMGPTIVPPELLKNKLKEPVRDILEGTPRLEELNLDSKSALALLEFEDAVRKFAYFPTPLASNNWIVSGKLTKDGSAILCNDPHLTHIEPSLFYLMRVKGAGFDAYGVAFPGEPYIVLGHTRKLAWGATTTLADAEDLFIEKLNPNNPNQYLYKGEYKNFTIRKEKIKIRIGFTNRYREKEITIRQSIHGPIINDVKDNIPKDMPPVALRWTGWDICRNPKVFEALVTSSDAKEFARKYKELGIKKEELMNIGKMYNYLMKGSSISDFIRAMDSIVVPNQSWISADADGHIVYLPGGLVPIRKKGRGMVPVPGWNGEYDWIGFIPLMELPHSIDPERGYMITANNEVVDLEWYPYTFATNYGPGFRAQRIEELILKEKPLDIEKMKRIQNDVYSKEGEAFAPLIVNAVLRKAPDDQKLASAIKYLKEWDYETNTDQIAPTIYYSTIRRVYENTLIDEFDPKFYEAYIKGRGLNLAVQMWLFEGKSEFFDDKRTKDKIEDMDDILVKSLREALSWLEKKLGKDMKEWQWGKLHTIEWSSPLGFGPLRKLNYGPFPHPGAEHTVRNAGFIGGKKNPFKCGGGPVLRHIMDMGKPDSALMVIDGSQSGRWLDKHYTDGHDLWLNSQYIQAVMDENRVRKESKSLLRLLPR